VDVQQVQRVDAEQRDALLEPLVDLVVGRTLGLRVDLRGEEDLFARDVRPGDALADVFLVVVEAGSVDVPVAYLQGVRDGLCALFGVGVLPGTESDRRERVSGHRGRPDSANPGISFGTGRA